MSTDKLQRREKVAQELDEAINAVAKSYGELTAINSEIHGNRKFDKVETDRRLVDRLTYALADPGSHQGPLGVGRISTTIAEAVRKDHAERRRA
jgi:hypothetical protein